MEKKSLTLNYLNGHQVQKNF